MQEQTPAQGILLVNDFGDAKVYHVECDCSSSDHAVKVWIEIDGDTEVQDVQVGFFVDMWTPFWDPKFTRFKAIWDLLTKGIIRQEHHLILNKQSALNFAATLEREVKALDKKSK